MDAIKLYSDWKNSEHTKEIIKIVDKPTSNGAFDIKDVAFFLIFFESEEVLECDTEMYKEDQTYTLHLDNVIPFYNHMANCKGPYMLTIGNGENELFLSVYEDNDEDAIYGLSFQSGSIRPCLYSEEQDFEECLNFGF